MGMKALLMNDILCSLPVVPTPAYAVGVDKAGGNISAISRAPSASSQRCAGCGEPDESFLLANLGWMLDRGPKQITKYRCAGALSTPRMLPNSHAGRNDTATCLIGNASVRKCQRRSHAPTTRKRGADRHHGTSVYGVHHISLRHPPFGHTSMQNGNSHPISRLHKYTIRADLKALPTSERLPYQILLQAQTSSTRASRHESLPEIET